MFWWTRCSEVNDQKNHWNYLWKLHYLFRKAHKPENQLTTTVNDTIINNNNNFNNNDNNCNHSSINNNTNTTTNNTNNDDDDDDDDDDSSHVPNDTNSEDEYWFLGFAGKGGDVFLKDVSVVVEVIGNWHKILSLVSGSKKNYKKMKNKCWKTCRRFES